MSLKNISATSRLNTQSFLSSLFLPLFLFIANPTSAAVPKVFYQVQEGEKCLWTVLDLGTDKTTVILDQFKKCSPHIFLHKTKKEGFAFIDNAVYRFQLGNNSADKTTNKATDTPTAVPATTPNSKFTGMSEIVKIAEAPKLGAMATPVVVQNGLFRIGHLIAIPEEDVIVKEKEKKTYYRYKGKMYLDDNPPMGSPALAEVLELKNGKFESIAITSTQFESEGTPGLLVVLDQLESSSDYVSISTLIKSGQCSEQDCTELKGWNTKTKKNIKKVLGLDKTEDDPSSDEPGFVSSDGAGAGRGLAAQVIWGDTAHFSPPVYFCDSFCEKSNVIENVELQQLSITAFDKDYFLLADEFSNNEALIVKFGTNAPIKTLPKSLHAVWATDDIRIAAP